jgi:hypothetical protein
MPERQFRYDPSRSFVQVRNAIFDDAKFSTVIAIQQTCPEISRKIAGKSRILNPNQVS